MRRHCGLLLLLLLFTSCSSNDAIPTVEGEVLVDGTPVDVGTIHLRAVDQPQSRGLGGAIKGGTFSLAQTPGIPSGKYLATIQASQNTGRIIKDQQKGEVPEIKPITLPAPTQEVEITAANAGSLRLEFTAKGT